MVNKSSFEIPSFRQVDEVYVMTNQVKDKYIKASYRNVQEFWNLRHSENDINKPSFADNRFYYTFLEGKIHLLPEANKDKEFYWSVQVVYQPDVTEFNIDSKLPINSDYKDILLSMAAMFAMQDTSNSEKVALYRSDIQEQLQALGIYANFLTQMKGIAGEK